MADDSTMDRDEIERLLDPADNDASAAPTAPDQPPPADATAPPLDQGKHVEESGAGPAPQPAAPKETAPEPPAAEATVLPSDVEHLLNQAEQALQSINSAATGELSQGVSSFHLEEFSGAPASRENATLDLIRDIELDLKIELGHTHMYLEDVLKLHKGSVVPLDKLAGDPVDIYVNGRLIARGEVLVLNDNFCVRVAELIAGVNVFA